MRSIATLFAINAIAFSIAAGCTNTKARDADSGRLGGTAADGTLSRTDRMFIENAVASGKSEVEHASLARTAAASDAVKQYAAHLLSAHTAANDELKYIIDRKEITLTDWPSQRDRRGSIQAKDDATTATKAGGAPSGSPSATGTTGASGTVATTGEALDRERAGTAQPWMRARGAAFDEGFLAVQVKAHQDAIALFIEEANHGADSDLKAFAQKQLPLLREHLRQAEELRRSRTTTPP
ncbi:MAG TPA: DUF4142 domain-containing protein [Vicinamibacterales bacterium]|nr:DUF4142 domain-containing protein [Vicinamibacterales bacterium]